MVQPAIELKQQILDWMNEHKQPATPVESDESLNSTTAEEYQL